MALTKSLCLQSFQLWRVRYCLLYQQVLEETSPHLFNLFRKDIELSSETQALLKTSTQLTVEHYLTVANMYNYYHYVTEADKYITKAQHALNIKLEMVGMLGRRTHFQESRAQLALRVSDADSPSSTAASPGEQGEDERPGDGEKTSGRPAERERPAEDPSGPPACPRLPTDVKLNDDTRLERVQYDEPSAETEASPLRQAVILATYFQNLRAQGRSEIRDEQLLVTISALTHQPLVWAVQLSALLQRSRLESEHRRTVERAMLQVEALGEDVSRPEPAATHRLQLFFSTRVPTHWELMRELAERYMAMGVTKSALDVYERYQLWEEAIRCYHLLQQRQRAAEVVREQIAAHGETPKLLCLLGDATDDVSCYQRAWQMSGEKYVRAVRSEGLYYYHRKQYEKCLPLLSKAVERNSLQFDVWTRLAFAALQTEDWKTCANAYRRCCYLEPDNYEAWNNIAHAYIRLGQKERAWKTLQEALRFSFDNWKIWDNFLVVSLDIGEFEEAISAYGRLAEIQERHVDCEVLRLLVRAVLSDTADRHGVGAGRLVTKLTKLFGRLTAKVTNNSEVWSLYGDLTGAAAASEEARFRRIQHYQKAHSCLAQKPGAEKQLNLAKQMLEIAVKLSEAALTWVEAAAPGSDVARSLASVKLSIRGTITKVKTAQTDSSGQVREELRQLYADAETGLQRVLDAIQAHQAS
ncbi:Tetratricopeptide repeat protein 27 [Amphibalanus amphitrite]|uniref:Tetratricopeptide repeat protein 27 n=1 Tax=Amphibalanus amphitrite TaxID=1232801 RepID=A0A6A4VRY1_AMPAM|nr:Tetratricopeptide repeat protein 27 [Amphibalanus amphitrite]